MSESFIKFLIGFMLGGLIMTIITGSLCVYYLIDLRL